ncbi:MAG: lipopolysaccharide transport periplasmic protein LptA [Campylobacterales bacterium]|nr:lipopolysaccharide transport periplasmic protein LptA [Campylobacterales bacterium]
MRIFSLLIMSVLVLFGEAENKLTIDAQNFSAEDQKNVIIFTGDVKMKRYKDIINANKLVINLKQLSKLNTKKEPVLYTATGDVYLEIVTTDKHYKAKGQEVIYKPLENKYIISGDGYAEDIIGDKKLYGEKIYIDTITGEAKIDGSKKKPVRFIMQLDK